MFITSFGEQNITYKCCSNFPIHLYTSDNKKPLSTRILSLKNTNQWHTIDRAKVLELIVTQCLRWPKGTLKKISFKSSTLNHPRMDIDKQEISANELETWLNRLNKCLEI